MNITDRRRKVSPEMITQISEWLKLGVKLKMICNHLGIDEKTLYRLRQQGIV